jgi:hypothetical protein
MGGLLVLVVLLYAIPCAPPPACAETRVALVVGNNAYKNTPANPRNDARDVAAALKSLGFDIVEALDADRVKRRP